MIELALPPLVGFARPAIVRSASLDLTKLQRYGQNPIVVPAMMFAMPNISRSRYPARVVTGSFEDSYDTDAGATTYNPTMGIGSTATGRIIVLVILSGGTNSTPTAVTIGGVNATLAQGSGSADTASSPGIWYAAVPTGTTATCSVTYSSSQNRHAMATYRLVTDTGDEAEPWMGDWDTASSSPGSISATVDCSDDGVLIGGAIGNDGNAHSVASPFTEDFEAAYGGESHGGSTVSEMSPAATGSFTATITCSDARLNIALCSFV